MHHVVHHVMGHDSWVRGAYRLHFIGRRIFMHYNLLLVGDATQLAESPWINMQDMTFGEASLLITDPSS